MGWHQKAAEEGIEREGLCGRSSSPLELSGWDSDAVERPQRVSWKTNHLGYWMLTFFSVYTRNSSASSEHVVGSLDRLQRQNSTLQYQMQFLRRKLNNLNSSDGDNVGRPQPKNTIMFF